VTKLIGSCHWNSEHLAIYCK